MSNQAALLDTDILSALLKRHPAVTQQAQAYLTEHERLSFSIMTRSVEFGTLLLKDGNRERKLLAGGSFLLYTAAPSCSIRLPILRLVT
jgi:hypothetical protein